MAGCPSHPIPPSQYISGPSSLAISHCSSVLQVFYNNKGYHSMPTYLNALNNAILRANLPKSKGNPAAYGEDLEAFEGRSLEVRNSIKAWSNQASKCSVDLGPSRLVSGWNRSSHTSALRCESWDELFVRPGLECPKVLPESA